MKGGENLLEKQIRVRAHNVPALARAIYTPGELEPDAHHTPLNAALLWCLSDRMGMYDPLIDCSNPRPIALRPAPQDKGGHIGPEWSAVPRTTTKLPTSKPR